MSIDLTTASPYDLMIFLRDNKFLYKYFEEVAVVVSPDNNWTIMGHGTEGETTATVISTGILRLLIPIKIEKPIPIQALQQLLISAQENTEGVLMVEIDEETGLPVIQYVIHTTIEGLDAGIIKFSQEKLTITKLIFQFTKTLDVMAKGMSKGFNHPQPSDSEPSDTSMWEFINKIDKDQNIDDLDDTMEDSDGDQSE